MAIHGLILLSLILCCSCIYIGAANETETLDWILFGEFVQHDQSNNYSFMYGEREDFGTVWIGKRMQG